MLLAHIISPSPTVFLGNRCQPQLSAEIGAEQHPKNRTKDLIDWSASLARKNDEDQNPIRFPWVTRENRSPVSASPNRRVTPTSGRRYLHQPGWTIPSTLQPGGGWGDAWLVGGPELVVCAFLCFVVTTIKQQPVGAFRAFVKAP